MSNQKKFNVIAALDQSNGIGKEGKLPWDLMKELKNCLKNLNRKTDKSKKNGWIWGKNSFLEYMTRSSPKRRIIACLTHDKKKFLEQNPERVQKVKEMMVFEGFDEALNYLSQESSIENIWICGGGEVYKQAVNHPMCDKIYVTRIFQDYKCDVFFPKIDTSKFKRDEDFDKSIVEEKGVKFQYQLYQRC